MALAIKQTGQADSGPRFGRLFDAGGRSLDATVEAAWRTLAVRGNARCLVCGETFVREDHGGARCGSCGTTLT
jgi:hypothetical protein